jgi:hypothetical protein
MHEFAHQLDFLDGLADGTPPLRDQSQYRRWHDVMTAEYARLVEESSHGGPKVLDSYGTTNAAEFFAVATECFFEKPVQMRDRHPDLYLVLRDYYNQDSAARFARLDAPKERPPQPAHADPEKKVRRARRNRHRDAIDKALVGVHLAKLRTDGDVRAEVERLLPRAIERLATEHAEQMLKRQKEAVAEAMQGERKPQPSRAKLLHEAEERYRQSLGPEALEDLRQKIYHRLITWKGGGVVGPRRKAGETSVLADGRMMPGWVRFWMAEPTHRRQDAVARLRHILILTAIFGCIGLFGWLASGSPLHPGASVSLSLGALLLASAAWLGLAIWWMDRPGVTPPAPADGPAP